VRRGVLVSVEGPDGAGKTTLVRALAERFWRSGIDAVVARDPGGTPIADAARGLVLDPSLDASPAAELFLYLAARAELVTRIIEPALRRGRLVLVDRFELSTLAYQVGGRGLPRDLVLRANRLATRGVKPEVTLVLDVPAFLGARRQRSAGKIRDRLEGETAGWHGRVAGVFRKARGKGIVHVDARRAAGAVERDAWAVLARRLPEPFRRQMGEIQ